LPFEDVEAREPVVWAAELPLAAVERLAEERPAEERLPEERLPEERLPEERLAELRLPDAPELPLAALLRPDELRAGALRCLELCAAARLVLFGFAVPPLAERVERPFFAEVLLDPVDPPAP
jgi:hypothetical protein